MATVIGPKHLMGAARMREILRRGAHICAFLGFATLAACGAPDGAVLETGGVYDPHEKANRNVHAFNLGVDKVFFRPASKGYTNLIPDPIEDSFNYFSKNLSEPGDMVNSLAQGRFKIAAISLARFVINTTIGIGGLSDPATDFGIPQTDTDFGETMAVWGIGEGAYVELPFFGPSTQRDAVGILVDFFTNPITFAVQNPLENAGVYAEILERMSDRGRYSDTVDSILYESADSYAQARLIYLQNRRFELADDDGDTYVDPYDDPFADIYEDPYAE